MVRSKYVKGPDNYGKVIPLAREILIKKNNGVDPGPKIVAAHKNFGSHFGTDAKDQEADFKSLSWNSAQSNMHRDKDGYTATDKIRMKNYKDPEKKKKTLKEIVKPQRSK